MSAVNVVAHRGDPVAHRENTLPAFRAAVAAGATTVELDVQVSADGVPVVLHDATTERLWGAPRAAAEQSAAELAVLGCGEDRIPTLAQALAALPGTRVLVDVTDAARARAALTCVREHGRTAADVAFCGSLAAMRAVRARWVEAPVWLPFDEVGADLARLDALVAELAPEVLNAHHAALTPALVRAVSARVPVACWTVDDPARARELAGWGVVSITSNRAGEVRRALTEETP